MDGMGKKEDAMNPRNLSLLSCEEAVRCLRTARQGGLGRVVGLISGQTECNKLIGSLERFFSPINRRKYSPRG